MRTKKQYQQITKRRFRPEITQCLTCQTKLRAYATLSERTLITLSGVIKLTHIGYRCPNEQCEDRARVNRSMQADMQALPGYSFGLDVVALVGYLKLHHHQTVDEVHAVINERLKESRVSMSRRNVMYLFEAYGILLTVAAKNKSDPSFADWLGQTRQDGGMILSIDGIQPDKGNETIYLIREVLTGRLLHAQNVQSSDAETIKKLFAPVLALQVPVLGVISDAQSSLRDAIAALFPGVPHQTCQFHYLQEAARPIFEMDRGVRAKMRKAITEKLRPLRRELEQVSEDLREADALEAHPLQEQVQILAEYSRAAVASCHLDGTLPFEYPGVKGYQGLEALERSLQQIKKERKKRESG